MDTDIQMDVLIFCYLTRILEFIMTYLFFVYIRIFLIRDDKTNIALN